MRKYLLGSKICNKLALRKGEISLGRNGATIFPMSFTVVTSSPLFKCFAQSRSVLGIC